MRIVKLEIKDFTSLKGLHSIDFQNELKGQDLFAITGPTGSGKTSLLNAISLALYGRSAKNQLSSVDFVALGRQEAKVKLWLTHLGKTYLVTWACKVLSNQGKRLKKPQLKREFYQKIDDELRPLDITPEELIGLSYDQFTRSVLLNQGEFALFLTSSFSDRRQILEKLYNGEDLSALKRTLHEKLKNQQATEESLLQKLDGLMPFDEKEYQKRLQDYESLKAKQSANKEFLIEVKKLSEGFKNLKDIIESYQRNLERIRKEKDLNTAQVEKLKEQKLELHKAQSKRDSKKKKLKEERPLIDQLISLKAQHDQLTKEFKQSELLKKENLQQTSQKEEASTKLKENRSLLLEKEKKAQGQLPSFLHFEQLERLKRSINFIEKRREEILSLSNTIAQTKAQLKSEKDELEKKKNYQKDKESEFQTYLNELEGLKNTQDKKFSSPEDLALSLKETQEQIQISLKELDQWQELDKKNEDQTRELSKRESEIKQRQKEHQAKEKELREKEAQRNEIQKWFELNELQHSLSLCIKKSLEEQECFVCGSAVNREILEHPLLKKDYTPDLNKRDQLDSFIQTTYRELERIDLKLKELSAHKDRLIQEIDHSKEKLSTPKKVLEEKLQELKKQLQSDTQIKENWERLTYKTKELSEFIGELKRSTQELEQKIQHSASDLESLEDKLSSSIQETLKRAPDKEIQYDLMTLKSWQENLNHIIHVKQQLPSLQSHQEEIERDLKNLKTQYFEILEELKLKDKLLKRAHGQIQAKLEALNDLSDLESLNGYLKNQEHELEKLENDVLAQQHQLEGLKIEQTKTQSSLSLLNEQALQAEQMSIVYKAQIQEIIEGPKTQSLGEQKRNWLLKVNEIELDKFDSHKNEAFLALYDQEVVPLVEQASEQYELFQEELHQHKAQIELYTSRLEQQKILKQDFLELQSKKKTLEQLHQLIGKDEFRNFALGLIERDLIQLTNHELEKMCEGRYRIDISPTKQAQEFNLIDYWQGGSQRKVSTLSGGETFLVSLAMALSLAEMSRGETEIDSFFIDEGFGSLDQDSLDEVVETLFSVRARGKQIGIISHIKELTQRIDVNIDLVKNQHGESHIHILHN